MPTCDVPGRMASCEAGIAVSNATEQLKQRADLVTEKDHGGGVVQLIERLLKDDLASLEPRLGRHGVLIGKNRDDGEFRQRVAIKIVRGGFATSALLERFKEERRILASLEHRNIARLLDGGTTEGGLPYVVMEFIEGEPIDRFCAES